MVVKSLVALSVVVYSVVAQSVVEYSVVVQSVVVYSEVAQSVQIVSVYSQNLYSLWCVLRLLSSQVCVKECPSDSFSPWIESQLPIPEVPALLGGVSIKDRMKPFCTQDMSEDILGRLSVSQLVEKPTFTTFKGDYESGLDHVYSNRPKKVLRCNC